MKPFFVLTAFVLVIAAQESSQAPTADEATARPPPAGAESTDSPAAEEESPRPSPSDWLPEVEYRSEQDIGLMARVHFATHTPDFDRSRAFYRMLGYTQGFSGFPLTNTHAVARALGMFDVCQYELVAGEVMQLPASPFSANIDLLQFKTPFNGDPPYELPNHLGMAYAALLTTDLDGDYAYLKARNVGFLSKPFGTPGDRFAFFRDPDGVLYRLMENAPPQPDPEQDIQIVAMPYIGVNVSDFDASLAFYETLGYSRVQSLPETGSLEEARAWGLDRPFRIRGADIAIDRGDRHVLRLVQWIEPFDDEPPYPPPINHIGIDRIALVVPDLDRAVAILKEQGVPFLSEIAPCCSGTGEDTSGIVHAIDPDGVFLELVGSIARRGPQPQPEGCPPLEIRMPEPSQSSNVDIE